MASVELRLLGGFELRTAAGELLPISAKKARALLAYLAVPPGRPHSREKLAALIWGDVSRDEQARRSLRQSLTTLRRSLPAGALEADRDTLALGASTSVDVGTFERLAGGSERASLEAALDLYRGEFLEGFSARADAFDEGVDLERARLRQLALAATERLCELQERAGEIEPAVATAMRLVAMDPLRESGHRQLMRLYERSGRTSEALRHFKLLRELLREELATEPDRETLALVERLQSGAERRAAAVPAPLAAPVLEGAAPLAALELRQVCALCLVMAPELAGERTARGVALLEQFGAQVVRSSAERVLAVFGLLRATGHEAERGVRAALAVRQELDADSVRVAVASGQVLAEPAHAGPLRGDVLRQAVELAEGASPGVWVSFAVARALGARLTLAEADAKARRRAGQRVLALSEVTDSVRATPFVGRRYELSQLAAALELAAQLGRGRAFLVRGDAGIGKTRLLTRVRAEALSSGFRVHARALLDFGGAAEEEPSAALVRELLDAPDQDPMAALTHAVSVGLVPSADVPLLLDVLQVLPPGARDREAAGREEHLQRRREAVARLLEAQCARVPRFVWVDDVHWADAGTLAQLGELVRVAARVSLVLVLTTRFEGAPESAEFRARLRGAALTTLDLSPLEPEEAEELARHIGPREDAARLGSALERAAGNPLFLEQLLQADHAGPLPDSIQSLIQARMDRLDPAERATLGAAAVLGYRFSLPALAHVLGVEQPALDSLLLQALITRDDEGHRFVHVLVREAVYASLTLERRDALHRRAAAFHAGRDLTLRAQHLERARDPEAPAALAAAAAAEQRKGNLERAFELCRRGLDSASSRQDRFALALQWGEVLCDLGRLEPALQAFEQARAAAETPLGEARAWVGLAGALRVLDRAREALSALSQAEQRIDPLRDLALVSRIHYLRGSVLFPLGDAAASLRSHTLALEAAQAAQSLLAEARALSGIADAHFISGHFSTARTWFSRCEATARAAGALELELSSRGMLAVIALMGSEPRRARANCISIAERYAALGMQRGEALMRTAAAWASLLLGDFPSALEHAGRAVELAGRVGAQRFEALGLSYQIAARCALEAAPELERELSRVLELAEASGIHFSGGAVYAARLGAARDPEHIRALLEEAERVLEAPAMNLSLMIFVWRAIPAALAIGQPGRVRRYAELVTSRFVAEPQALATLIAEVARALADWAEGGRAEELQRRLAALRARLVAAELQPTVEWFDRTLAAPARG